MHEYYVIIWIIRDFQKMVLKVGFLRVALSHLVAPDQIQPIKVKDIFCKFVLSSLIWPSHDQGGALHKYAKPICRARFELWKHWQYFNQMQAHRDAALSWPCVCHSVFACTVYFLNTDQKDAEELLPLIVASPQWLPETTEDPDVYSRRKLERLKVI